MMTLNKLLDKARSTCDRDSDRALAQALKVTGTTVMEWRRGNRRITDEHLMDVIKRAQADPALAVLVRREGAETMAEKQGWGVVWDRLSPVTTVIGAMVLAIGMMPATSRAKPLEIQGFAGSDFAYSVYYVRTCSVASYACRLQRGPECCRWLLPPARIALIGSKKRVSSRVAARRWPALLRGSSR
ncbi:hypothetical protein NX81_011945 [Xanthomonas vasicola]|nr:hypothetical protein NX81_011945 [Xanthomonas vasicola]